MPIEPRTAVAHRSQRRSNPDTFRASSCVPETALWKVENGIAVTGDALTLSWQPVK
jgi:hypothetical protein